MKFLPLLLFLAGCADSPVVNQATHIYCVLASCTANPSPSTEQPEVPRKEPRK